jgi:hypothetical protein
MAGDPLDAADAEGGVHAEGTAPPYGDAVALDRALPLGVGRRSEVSVPSNTPSACVPSQNGFEPERPHRHSAYVSSVASVSVV